MKKSNNFVDKKNLILFQIINKQVFFLFLLITISCLFLDLYLKTSNLTAFFIITTFITIVITYSFITKLKKINVKQIIREEGPKNHYIKQGTPTMGGIFFIPTGIIISNTIYFNTDYSNIIFILSFLIMCFMSIGLIDDILSLKKQLNTGLTTNQKLILQFLISIIFIIICASNNYLNSNIEINNRIINIGNFIYPLGIFVLLAESNSTNLTDGLDGLLSGCSALIFTGLAIEIILKNESNYQTLAPFCIVIAGACMGFLFLNKYPAKLFMGDSGSLAIGATLGGVGLLSNNLWSLFIMGGILLIEAISVIIQVSFFKISKRLKGKGYKIFLMTPIHHHFELKGNNEKEIVSGFWLITLLLIIINLIF